MGDSSLGPCLLVAGCECLMRRAAKVDENQKEIVSQLRTIPGVTVEPNHHDILVGFRGATFWYEIKSKRAVSKRTGKAWSSSIQKSQKRLQANYTGHYRIVSSLEEILEDLGVR